MSKGYSRPTYSSPSSKGFSSGKTSSKQAKQTMNRSKAHKDTNPRDRRIMCDARFSLRFVLDDTGSNKELANIFYDKVPMVWGQIMYPGKTIEEIREIEKGRIACDVTPYLEDYAMSIGFVGDANGSNPDKAPLQVSNFLRGEEFEKWLPKLWKEGGGGGQGMETYELDAFYDLHFCDMPNSQDRYYFLVADEAPYPKLKRNIVKHIIGKDIPKDIATTEVYRDLFQKYNGKVYILLNPYCGRNDDGSEWDSARTKNIMQAWKEIVGPEYANQVIRIYQEKSIFDIILGIIARASGARDKAGYTRDMKTKGQDAERIKLVNKSLAFLDVKKARTNSDMPETRKKRKSGGRRL